MSEQEALGIAVGIIFTILGLAIIVRYKKLTSHQYFRYLIVIIAILSILFGIYIAARGIYLYG